ncbi:MAG TPA: helix-turn-helix transcriptional regulator [Acidimicrobiales bacterium]|nr:helix-turn-helix transcriptional regulator [Acidimicrobiales bacterium]
MREGRGARSWSQQQLAERVGKSKQWVAAVEVGRVLPPVDQVVGVCRALYPDEGDGAPDRLACWLVYWLQAAASVRSSSPEEATLLGQALAVLDRDVGKPSAAGDWRSLDQFPTAFEPLTLVAADRRDTPPETRADLFILSGAVGDLTFLPNLRETRSEVRLRSDKLVVLGPDDMRRRELGSTNLLVVSSPAANWAARVLNSSALFRYDIPGPARELDARIRTLGDFDDGILLRLLWRLVSSAQETDEGVDVPSIDASRLSAVQRERLPRAEELARELLATGKPEEIMSQFNETGILDPVAGRRYQLPADNFDYGMISLAPNPWARDKFVSILVSGMHGTGTAHALGALISDPQMFAGHPFGGVIQVHAQPYADWSERFLRADWEWKTPEYTPQTLLQRLRHALEQGTERPEPLNAWTDTELADCIRFIETLPYGSR